MTEHLSKQHQNEWLAIRVQGQLSWNTIKPRSEAALLSALHTDERDIICRIADVIAPLVNDDLERAYVVAGDCLRAVEQKQ